MYAALWLVLSFLSFGISHQDPIAVNPKIVSVEFESDRIRVLRVRFGPQDRLEWHSHPALAVIALTPNSRRTFRLDGTQQDSKADTGDVSWREPGTHAVQNLGESFESIEIEFKRVTGPAVPISPANVPIKPGAAGVDIAVEQEPHHHVLLENQYVRILEVRIPPGGSLLFHTHSYDNLSVRISGGLIRNQLLGGAWSAATEVRPGAVVFAAASTKPYTHRVENLGTSSYHVVDVEFLK
jgi:quercetin dioxygenase-like cupin family protein